MSFFKRTKGFCIVPLFIIIISLFALTYCVSTPHPQVYFKPYYDILKREQKKKSIHIKLHQTFQVQAVLLNQDLERAQIEQKRQMLKYNPTEMEEELRVIHDNNTKNTRFFLSVYTHKRSLNNLNLTTGFWRIFLHIDGQNLDGKAKVFNKSLTEMKVLYPFHTQWHKGYIVTFPIPLQDIHGKKLGLHLHSPLGNTKMTFY